ncbi:MAG: ATP-binding cassette domain-containing protein [Crocinitomicaceae bacterium]|nr:ATP-binding cassette domain-containing protein [Crocinitomicaceae bacterium]
MILSFSKLSLSIGENNLLVDASFSFSKTTRCALIGTNGTGKSSLLKVLNASNDSTIEVQGDVVKNRDAVVEYVPQFAPEELLTRTVFEAITLHMNEVRPQKEDWQVYALLDDIGIDSFIWDEKLENLSGGQINTVMLARSVIVDPDLILLDEPTNHLDTEGIIRFQFFMEQKLKIPFCIISHDRELLDMITKETLIIRDGELMYFGVPYTQAMEQLRLEDESKLKQYLNEGKEIKRLKETQEKMKNWVKGNSGLAARYQTIKKRIDDQEQNRTQVSKSDKRKLKLSDNDLRVKRLLGIESINVTTPDGRQLYSIENFFINKGDRVAILGKNGSGKSTLLNLLYSKNDNIKINPLVSIGYYRQDFSDMNKELSLTAYLEDLDLPDNVITSQLVSSGFPYKSHTKKIEKTSGGEKSRLKFLYLKLMDPNFYFLDEPTNHIDVQGIEMLELDILNSSSTFIMVSHDRRFIENVANRYFLIDNDVLREIHDPNEYYNSLNITN